MVLQLVAKKVIKRGESILWTYGDGYDMDCRCTACQNQGMARPRPAAEAVSSRAVRESLTQVRMSKKQARVTRAVQNTRLASLRLEYMRLAVGNGATGVSSKLVEELNAPGLLLVATTTYAAATAKVGSGSTELFAAGAVFGELLKEMNPVTKQVHVVVVDCVACCSI